ncbi:folylpolyglutamate synthase [Clostridiales bacterium PH28_bin88]|nr:folylpolyglutamate synthase [Clostridiales bacterium PH28_bin88]
MTYDEAIDFLKGLAKFGFRFGLDRIIRLLDMLGNPQCKLKVIHVGGTNGKGSTSAMIAGILQSAGYRVGLFTSPHLHSYTERTRVNGEDIPEEKMAELITRLKPLLERMVAEGHEHPTEFEVNTALSLLYFYEERVDVVVLEVGLGGAIDSTNVIADPLVAVITNVGMDHMDYLGNTIEEIAKVKAGIIKPRGLVVTASDREEALAVIEDTCREQQAELFRVGRDITWTEGEANRQGIRFSLSGLNGHYPELYLPLLGRHQVVNAATAVLAVEVLEQRGIAVSQESIRIGLARTVWPARLEVAQNDPTVLLDVAHNYDGAVSLRRALEEFFRYRRLILVIGMLGDKEREKVMGVLSPVAHTVVVTRPLSPRAGDWRELARLAERHAPEVYVMEDVRQAVSLALSFALPEDLVCVTGSFYTVAEARKWLQG